jgi:hypothetical protein
MGTPTASPLPSGGPNPVPISHLPLPNPQQGLTLGMAVELQGYADSLEIRVFTKAMTCVRDISVPGSFGPGWNHFSASLGSPLPLGIYYTLLKASNGSFTSKEEGPVKLMVVR